MKKFLSSNCTQLEIDKQTQLKIAANTKPIFEINAFNLDVLRLLLRVLDFRELLKFITLSKKVKELTEQEFLRRKIEYDGYPMSNLNYWYFGRRCSNDRKTVWNRYCNRLEEINELLKHKSCRICRKVVKIKKFHPANTD